MAVATSRAVGSVFAVCAFMYYTGIMVSTKGAMKSTHERLVFPTAQIIEYVLLIHELAR